MVQKIYTSKSEKEWQNIVKNYMPNGKVWNAVGKKGTVLNTILETIAHIYFMQDKQYEILYNNLALTPTSNFLDEYWDLFQISRFIKEKPAKKEDKYKIINAFAKAFKGLNTAEQIENFIKDIFGVQIDIYISNSHDNIYRNKFPAKFNFSFRTVVEDDNSIIIRIPRALGRTENVLPTYSFPFPLRTNDDFSKPIIALLELIIDINFKIYYI